MNDLASVAATRRTAIGAIAAACSDHPLAPRCTHRSMSQQMRGAPVLQRAPRVFGDGIFGRPDAP